MLSFEDAIDGTPLFSVRFSMPLWVACYLHFYVLLAPLLVMSLSTFSCTKLLVMVSSSLVLVIIMAILLHSKGLPVSQIVTNTPGFFFRVYGDDNRLVMRPDCSVVTATEVAFKSSNSTPC